MRLETGRIIINLKSRHHLLTSFGVSEMNNLLATTTATREGAAEIRLRLGTRAGSGRYLAGKVKGSDLL